MWAGVQEKKHMAASGFKQSDQREKIEREKKTSVPHVNYVAKLEI